MQYMYKRAAIVKLWYALLLSAFTNEESTWMSTKLGTRLQVSTCMENVLGARKAFHLLRGIRQRKCKTLPSREMNIGPWTGKASPLPWKYTPLLSPLNSFFCVSSCIKLRTFSITWKIYKIYILGVVSSARDYTCAVQLLWCIATSRGHDSDIGLTSCWYCHWGSVAEFAKGRKRMEFTEMRSNAMQWY